ncbi:hypothetical protein [Chitinimonas arctica]|uniref:hypothetical protein n=1 Tax=Chitinimonas arctica TaxID=2594795 RepID=UPI0021DF70FF|nr:hypothetical protein [Chitinimonas arctica]
MDFQGIVITRRQSRPFLILEDIDAADKADRAVHRRQLAMHAAQPVGVQVQ